MEGQFFENKVHFNPARILKLTRPDNTAGK